MCIIMTKHVLKSTRLFFSKYAPFWKSSSPVCTLQRGIGVICNKCCATNHLSTKKNCKGEPNCRHHAWQQAQQKMINTPDRHGWWEAPTQNCNTYIPKTHKQKQKHISKKTQPVVHPVVLFDIACNVTMGVKTTPKHNKLWRLQCERWIYPSNLTLWM